MTLIATPGAFNANSYLTVVEAQTYFDTRLTVIEWDAADSQEALLIMATRTLDMMCSGAKLFVNRGKSTDDEIIFFPKWTGFPATSTQRLAWPRTGMYDRNGNPIDPTIVPQDLKDAVAELAGQLARQDSTIDNDVAVQGISSVRAGSVSVSFNNSTILTTKILPDVVLFMLVPSWLTELETEPTLGGASIEVML